MQIRQLIEELLEVFQEFKRLDDSDMVDILITRGLTDDIAWIIVCFVPLAFCQVMLESDVSFSKTYEIQKSDGQREEKHLIDEPFFQEAIAVAESKVGVNTGDLWLSVAGRSAPFHAINELLNEGSRLEDLRLTSVVMFDNTEN